MPHINLLPWREAERTEKQRQFMVIAVGASVLAALMVAFIHIQFTALINSQNARNKFLQDTIKSVEKDIAEIKTLKEDKKALLARMEVIQQLQRSRPEIVHLFEELAKATPKGVYILKTARKGRNLHIEGVANSNDSVSAFMRQLDASAWLTNPKLSVINAKKAAFPNSSWFQLEVNQTQTEGESKEASK